MAETNGKLTELRYLPEDLLGDKVNAPVLRSEVNLGLEPAGADLDATAIRRGHSCAVVNSGAKANGRGRQRAKTASSRHADRR